MVSSAKFMSARCAVRQVRFWHPDVMSRNGGAVLRVVLALACSSFAQLAIATEVGQPLARDGDEIMVCGRLFHTTAPVVLWLDPGGYDAYRVERRFSPWDQAAWKESAEQSRYLSTPNRFGLRKELVTDEQLERVRGGGWNLPLLTDVVDQFVIHYDVCGVSKKCFEVLHDHRGLSVHFLLDIDGTIYQTLDLKERAWHATIANSRSIGVEIANIGAYPVEKKAVLQQWYTQDADGNSLLRPPSRLGYLGLRDESFDGRPSRNDVVVGTVQGAELYQYDFTPEQYDSLIKLTATLCRVFPKLKCTYPKDDQGQLIPHQLTPEQWRDFQGVLGHYHVQKNKVDPGPAFDWPKVIQGAAELLD